MRRNRNSKNRKAIVAAAVVLCALLMAGTSCSPSDDDGSQREEPTSQGQLEQTGFADAPESTGNPRHVFQLSEILACDPASAASFFNEIGLTPASDPSIAGAASDLGDALWLLPADSGIYSAADPAGEFFDYDAVSGATDAYLQMGVGLTWLAHDYGSARTVVTPDALASGYEPDSIVLGRIPFRFMTSAVDLLRLSESCGIGSALSVMALDASTASQQVVAVGFANSAGDPMMWCLVMNDYAAMFGDEDFSTIGSFACCSLSAAREAVEGIGLFSAEAFDAASDAEKAAMFAKSVLQDFNTGNGGVRRNFETGDFEALELTTAEDGSTVRAWGHCTLSTDEQTGEQIIVSDATGASYGSLSSWGALEQSVERGWYELI